MPSWFGPVTLTRSPVDLDPVEAARNPLGNRLMRHYGGQPEGVNVYILTSGAVTQDDPVDLSLVAHTLWGGHVEPITAAEATLLTAAGYGAYIT